MKEIISIGNIIIDLNNEKKYRIVSTATKETIICEMNTSKLKITAIDTLVLIDLIDNNFFDLDVDEPVIFDIDSLTLKAKNKYILKKKVITEVLNVYGCDLLSLCGKGEKCELRNILSKYSIPTNTFWRFFTKHLQSGMQDYSLIDSRYLGFNKGKKYNYSAKPGHRSYHFISTGVKLTDKIIDIFDEALNIYRSGRHITLKSCYDRMNALYFSKTEIINGIPTLCLLPESERPTIRQFYYYASKHISDQEKDALKTSVQEQRNNKRLITSDSLCGICGPGDMVEIDACEADVSLVSTIDPGKVVGRPIVYFMIDVFTRMILAMSVSFDNNSNLGITNLFLNLVDDKQEYCSKFGLDFYDSSIWQSNILPRRLRVDRGPEFLSKEFDRICNELGIEKQILPGGSGSLKGIVEQSFHQMHSKQNLHLENHVV